MTAVPARVRTAMTEAARSVLALAEDTDAAFTFASLLADTCYELGTALLSAAEADDQGAAVRRIRDDLVPDVVRRLSDAADRADAARVGE